jgi:soluble lytic murein transglycosylase-like protein
VDSTSSWRTLAEMDVHFARSRRRAASRRLKSRRRSPINGRIVRALVIATVLLGFVGESTRLEIQSARSGTPVNAAAIDPACPIPLAFHAAFRNAARETGLPLALLVATAYTESHMDPNARSHAGARGLFQLMPATAQSLSRRDDPASNVLSGARYLKQLLARFDGNLELALSAYNAGPTAVERAGRAPTLETLTYVKNVEARTATFVACR